MYETTTIIVEGHLLFHMTICVRVSRVRACQCVRAEILS